MKAKQYLAKLFGLYTKEDMFQTTDDMLKACTREVTHMFNSYETKQNLLNLTKKRLLQLQINMADNMGVVAHSNNWEHWFDEHGITDECCTEECDC